ncbi:MAG: hypothetical protein PHH01_00405 [Patescibacteria group bacterium]|nr:hypothetical protein [Patescibacteria group bacterium]
MSEGMLGKLPLSEIRGPRDDLEEKLSGAQGPMWLRAFKQFLRRENPWGIPNTIVITTNGRNGEQLIFDLRRQGNTIGRYAEGILYSTLLIVSNGKMYTLVIIPGDGFVDSQRTNQNIRAAAVARSYQTPPMELAPYLREKFSDEDLEQMGVRALILMHEPVAGLGGPREVLGVRRHVCSDGLLSYPGRPNHKWPRGIGFVFLAPASS